MECLTAGESLARRRAPGGSNAGHEWPQVLGGEHLLSLWCSPHLRHWGMSTCSSVVLPPPRQPVGRRSPVRGQGGGRRAARTETRSFGVWVGGEGASQAGRVIVWVFGGGPFPLFFPRFSWTTVNRPGNPDSNGMCSRRWLKLRSRSACDEVKRTACLLLVLATTLHTHPNLVGSGAVWLQSTDLTPERCGRTSARSPFLLL